MGGWQDLPQRGVYVDGWECVHVDVQCVRVMILEPVSAAGLSLTQAAAQARIGTQKRRVSTGKNRQDVKYLDRTTVATGLFLLRCFRGVFIVGF